MKLRYLVVPLAILGLACGGGRGETGDLPGNGNGNGNGNGGDDSVADDSGGGGPGRLCPAYTGLGFEGRSWAWEYTPETVQSSGTDSSWAVTTHSINGDEVVTRSVGELEHPSYDRYDWTMTSTYRCDDEGAWLLSYSQRVDLRSGSTEYWLESDGRYTRPYLVMPAGAGEGDSWTVDYEGVVDQTTSYSDPTSTEFDGSYTMSLHAYGDIDVPAGRFQALELRVDGDPSSWVDQDAGAVETVNSYLVDYSP
jgi:hypothetical protein